MQSTPNALQDYTGTYSNPGYGSFTLCNPTNSRHTSYCIQALSDFATVYSQSLNYTLSTQLPQLFASWSHLWVPHMRLVQISGTSRQSDVEMVTLFSEGYGDDKTPFEFSMEGGLAEFVAEVSYPV